MTRNGKIARLPHHLREELNRRLENGEPGVRLIEWLNTLPEVKEVLKTCFNGNPISDSNLTEWKQGGFLEWQAQRQITADLQDFKAYAGQLAHMTASVADIEAAVLAHYATALHRSNGEITDQFRAQLQCYSKSLRDVVRYRRCEQTSERTQIQRERLKLAQSNSQSRSSPRPSTPVTELTEEEKQRRLKERIFPRDLFPEKYQDDPEPEENNSASPQADENHSNP